MRLLLDYRQYMDFMPLFHPVIYALLGTSKQLAVGPVAMDSLLVAAGLGTISILGPEEYIQSAILLAFLSGTIQFLLGFSKWGFWFLFCLNHS